MIKIDHAIFEDHFRKHFVSLCRYAYGFVRGNEQAREIVQDVFSTIWEKKETLIITESVAVYLYRMVRNRSLNYLRDHRSITFVSAVPEVPADEPEAVREVTMDIRAILDVLPERCREIFMLKRFDGLTYKQIGVRLNISEKSVENQMTIAFRKLREEIKIKQKYLGEDD